MLSNLKRSTKRLLVLLAVLPATVFVLGTVYMFGMEYLEGTPRTFLASPQWATETLTTTGYGGDNRWQHPMMAAFVIAGQFMGQFLVFLIFPIFVLPYFEEQFEVRLQHILPQMHGKVLFYRYGPAIESLLEEFKRTDTPFVIFEEDMAVARNLRDRHYNVVFGKLADDPAVLGRVHQARAVVTNAGDYDNATCAMIVREHGFDGPLYALAEDPLYRPPMLQIGATDVFTPAHVLGAAIASRASIRISPRRPKACTCSAAGPEWQSSAFGQTVRSPDADSAIFNCARNTASPSSANGWAATLSWPAIRIRASKRAESSLPSVRTPTSKPSSGW